MLPRTDSAAMLGVSDARQAIQTAIWPFMRRCANAEKHAAAKAAFEAIQAHVRAAVQAERREWLQHRPDHDRIIAELTHKLGCAQAEARRWKEYGRLHAERADRLDDALHAAEQRERNRPTLAQRWFAWWSCKA